MSDMRRILPDNRLVRPAAPRLMARYPSRWWVGGVHPDVDLGIASHAAADTGGEVVRVYGADPEISGRALANWRARHARWATHRAPGE